jgi:hypothetical protein
MDGTAVWDVAELVRDSAVQEAIERSKTRTAPPDAPHTDAPESSSVTERDVGAAQDIDELVATYHDEKHKNDVLAKQLDKVRPWPSAVGIICYLQSTDISPPISRAHRDGKRW